MKVTRDRVKTWPVTGIVLGLVALMVAGLAYWSNVLERERYLQSRNFRFVAELASQTSNLIENRARIFRDTVGDSRVQALAGQQAQAGSSWQDVASGLMRTDGVESDLARAVIMSPASSDIPPTAPELRFYRLAVRGEGPNLLVTWLPPFSASPQLSMSLPASATLANTFRPKLSMGAFDTLILATPAGQVVYAVGRRGSEMQATSVTAILPIPAGKERADVARFADTISEQRVEIAGVSYRMFAQPCCRSDALDSGSGHPAPTGFVVIGLAETEVMRVASWAISPVLVLFGVVAIMAAFVGWPFLKCALMGAQQRITRRDVIGLGSSALFGLALATILLLSIAAYARLSADVSAQLATLANSIHGRFEEEVRRAANQARAMTEVLRTMPCVSESAVNDAILGRLKGSPSLEKDGKLADPCWAITKRWADRNDLPAVEDGYDSYRSFSLIDVNGFQRVRASRSASNIRQTLVVEREYFQQVITDRGLWRVAACPDGCFLESLLSWSSGKPQVVLARSTGIRALPVATLAIPMHSVIDPVLPPGFEFAVVNQEGQVQFHSDSQRNLHENLLLETDGDVRLQSLLYAHGEGALDTYYWGRPYRAHVRPTVIPGWSIVTLHDKQQTRSLVLEWTAAALSMQALYTLGWIVAMLVIMWRGASWLWPDPLRRPWYGPIAMVSVATLVLWSVIAARYEVITAAVVGVVAPIVVWAITYLLLATRPPGGGPKAWSQLCRDYQLAGALLLVVTATVPATAFFALSYDIHVESYVKERQIQLAQKAQEMDLQQLCSAAQPETFGFSQPAHYGTAFYGSEVKCGKSLPEHGPSHGLFEALHEVEHLLPYFTSASIRLRELMHERSGDGTWSSSHDEPGRQVVAVRVQEPAYQLTVESPLPAFVGIRGLESERPLVVATIVALALLPVVGLAAFAIVAYLLRRVVLADVVEPARQNETLTTAVGQHVLLLCDVPTEKADRLADVYVLPLTPIVSSANISAAWRRARASVNEVAPIQRVAIPDLDDRLDDVGRLRRKMELIEELMSERDQTVILLSSHDSALLTDRARAASKWDADLERGPKLLARMTVVEQRKSAQVETGQPVASTPASWWREFKRVVVALHTELLKRWQSLGVERNWREDLIASECQSHPALGPICAALRDTPAFRDASLTRDQILEEFEDRATPFYQRIWDACDPDERVVLEHVARHGLASAASRRVVRRLLARRLLRKDPELRLMNRSFTRFVLEAERTREVAALEREAEPSVWDRVRIPLGIASVFAIGFLVVTQRQAFDATMSMAVGVSAAVPTLVKLTNMLTQLGVRASGDGKRNG